MLSIQINSAVLYKKLTLKYQPKTPFHEITTPYKITRRGVQMKLIIGGKIKCHTPDNHLIKTIKEAHKWSHLLCKRKTVMEIAFTANKDYSIIIRTLRLRFLAPDIIEAFLDGSHPQTETSAEPNPYYSK